MPEPAKTLPELEEDLRRAEEAARDCLCSDTYAVTSGRYDHHQAHISGLRASIAALRARLGL